MKYQNMIGNRNRVPRVITLDQLKAEGAFEIEEQTPIITPQSTSIINPSLDIYQFLEGDFGREIDKEVQAKYAGITAITKIGYNANAKVVTGSNSVYVVAVNEILRKYGMRTANQAELEAILKGNILQLRNYLEDSGLVLRTESEPNEYLAKNLGTQLRARGINQYSTNNPLVIWLNQLELEKDSNSPYGLAFKLTDETQPFYAPVLSSDCFFTNTDSNGLPIPDINGTRTLITSGTRTLITRSTGLAELNHSNDLDLWSDFEFLDSSASNGRVVIVNPKGNKK